MPRLPIPSNPLDIINALRVLPGMARDTAAMAKSTEVLKDLQKDMANVAVATKEIGKIDARMANIEAAMPVLVEVQTHLTNLPETMDRLDRRLAELSTQLEALQESLGPIGRLALRMPGGRRAERRAEQAEA